MEPRQLHVTKDGTTRVTLPKSDLQDDGVLTDDDELVHKNAYIEKESEKEYRLIIIDAEELLEEIK